MPSIIEVFQEHAEIVDSSLHGLKSDDVMSVLAPGLLARGFEVEQGKRDKDKIHRPVFFGECGKPTLRYEIDGYHPVWKCGIEIEAGRATMGNAIYRDLIQGLIMADVDHLVLAVPNSYNYKSSGKTITSKDYEKTTSVAEALFGHTRVRMPYDLTVIGY